jgi:hypothetical protein
MSGAIRICPARDGACPHGDACRFWKDRYQCDIEASRESLRHQAEMNRILAEQLADKSRRLTP